MASHDDLPPQMSGRQLVFLKTIRVLGRLTDIWIIEHSSNALPSPATQATKAFNAFCTRNEPATEVGRERSSFAVLQSTIQQRLRYNLGRWNQELTGELDQKM